MSASSGAFSGPLIRVGDGLVSEGENVLMAVVESCSRVAITSRSRGLLVVDVAREKADDAPSADRHRADALQVVAISLAGRTKEHRGAEGQLSITGLVVVRGIAQQPAGDEAAVVKVAAHVDEAVLVLVE